MYLSKQSGLTYIYITSKSQFKLIKKPLTEINLYTDQFRFPQSLIRSANMCVCLCVPRVQVAPEELEG